MKYIPEPIRRQHPQMGLIPSSLWHKLYTDQFTDDDAKVFEMSFDEFIQWKDSRSMPNKERLRNYASFLISHPSENTERLLSLGKETLELPETDLYELASNVGNLALLKEIEKDLSPEQVKELVEKDGYILFKYSAEAGHLDILKHLESKAPDQILAMIEAGNFYAYTRAATNGHTDILIYLEKKAPHHIQRMIEGSNFYSYIAAARSGHLNTLIHLESIYPDLLQAIFDRTSYYVYAGAASHGQLKVLKHLEGKVPDQVQDMIRSDDFEAYLNAARGGHLEVMKHLEDQAPDKVQDMIRVKDYRAYAEASGEGHFQVMKHIEKIADDPIRDMIESGEFYTYAGAAFGGHLEIMKHLEDIAPNLLRLMMAARSFVAFNLAAAGGKHDVCKHLLAYPYTYGHVEQHYNEQDFQPYAIAQTRDFLSTLRQDMDAFAKEHPSGVFDFASGDATKDAERTLYGYYVLRQLIRQLPDAAYYSSNEANTLIITLLEIPSIRDLVLLNATQTSFPQDHPLGSFDFAQQPNELLRLAVNVGDQGIIEQLLAYPVIAEEAVRNDYYQEASGIDLRAMARDRESSMTGLTPEEQKRVEGIEKAYQAAIQSAPGGIPGIIDDLRNDLKEKFLAPEHLAERQVKLKERNLVLTLPFEYEAFQDLIKEHQLNPKEVHKLNKGYYKNIYHTAWRYLSKPNRWMDEKASFVYVNEDRTERWSSFEQHRPFIAYLYYAAKDEEHPPIEQNTSLENRVDLFVRALALINRQHNWDKTRPKMVAKGQQLFSKRGEPVSEEYDDMRGDCPSCFPGVKRNLFQSLLGHPLYTPITPGVIRQFIREEIRAHYANVLKDCSYEELMTIKEDTEDCIYDPDAKEPPSLKALHWDGEKFIQEKIDHVFKERGKPFHQLINEVLHPDEKENTFIGYWKALSFDQLVDKLIEEKSQGHRLRQ